LASLSKFVIVDITNPRSAPLELQATVPDYLVPFSPIAAWPIAARAQQAEQTRRIGVLMPFDAQDPFGREIVSAP
jgi:hypothetical protein